MALIDIQNVSLVFPLYAAAATTLDVGNDARVIVGDEGQILGVRALSDINFRIDSGDRLAIVGEMGPAKRVCYKLSRVLCPLMPGGWSLRACRRA